MKSKCTWIILVLILLVIVPVALAQPPVPHNFEEEGVSYEDCVACHRSGQGGAPLLAADHARHENSDCRVCHGTTGMLTPNVTHPVAGWRDCRGCHDRWENTAGIQIPNIADSTYDHAIYDNDDCLSCHPLATTYYDGVPTVACGVCHPVSAAAETVHNNATIWVNCVDCHEAAAGYPHDPERIQTRDQDCLACHHLRQGHWTSAQPETRYSRVAHIAEGDPHVRSDCSACHLQIATVERDPVTGRIHVVLPETEEGVPPDNPELAMVQRQVDCQRCHASDNVVAAPQAELPPRSVLCLACHDATPVVRDGISWAGLGIFGLGMVVTASIWLRGSVAGRKDLPLLKRIGRLFLALLDLLTTPRLFVLIWSFIVDGLLHRRLFQKSKLHWLTHALMFFGMAGRMLMGVATWKLAWLLPTAGLTQMLVNKNAPVVALFYDLLGLAVIVGAVLAIIRRYVVKDKQFITSQQDTVAIALLGTIFVLGFVLEGVRILTTDLRPALVAFSFVGYLVSLLLGWLPVAWGAVYPWLWYIHAGLVALFVAYLPFSKFIHILIGPIVAAFNSALEARVA